VAMHADRCLGSDGETIDFLGEKACFPVGPYIVAAVSQAPLVHVFAMRQSTYSYKFKAYPPERLVFGDRNERKSQLGQWARRFVSRLEETLRRYPLQWCNFYDFWRMGDSSKGVHVNGRA
jgi:predicted LPLAT superfamily acyltransferase